MSCTELHTKTPTPELPALPDALQERDEVARDLGLLVLERDGALAVVRLDAVVPEAGVGRRVVNGRLCLLWTKQDFVDYYADAETCAPVSWYFHNMRTRFDTIDWAPGDAAPQGSFAPPAYCLGRTSAVA